jgi:hypothetical protein
VKNDFLLFTLSVLSIVAQYGDWKLMNLKGFGRKHSWPYQHVILAFN